MKSPRGLVPSPRYQWGLRAFVLSLCIAAIGGAKGGFAKGQGFQEAQLLRDKIKEFSYYIIAQWQADPKLKGTMPPQIITAISADTSVIGGCLTFDTVTGKLGNEVGGTSYCPPTNTIYVVQEQLAPLQRRYGNVAVGYALAHEYGHYLQAAFKMDGPIVQRELQADCLAGVILGQGSQQLGLTQSDIVNMAGTAYSLSDEDHGTGAQRAYAVYTGLGQTNELTCSMADMKKLSENKVSDPLFGKLMAKRSGGQKPVEYKERGPYLKSITGSMGV